MRARRPGESALSLLVEEFARDRRFLLDNAIVVTVCAAAEWWWVWLTLWLLPMATWLPCVSRIRNIAEHALIRQNEADPLRQARTTRANWLERALVAPYCVNYHCEHHMFTQLACCNLPRAHRMLARRHATARMQTERGYVALLTRACAA